MKTFKNAKWDLDAENNTFQELFQKPNKKTKVIENHAKKAKKKIKNLERSIKKHVANKHSDTSDIVNLINTSISGEILTKSKKRRVKILQKKLKNQNDASNGNQSIKSKNKKVENVGNDQNLSKSKKKKLKKKLETKFKDKLDTISENSNLIKQKQTKITNGTTNSFTKTNDVSKNKKKRKKAKKNLNGIDDSEESLINPTLKNRISKVKKLALNDQSFTENSLEPPSTSLRTKKKEKFIEKLKGALHSAKEMKPVQTLRQKMMEKLKAARFRFINEQIYTADSKEAQKIFKNDPDAFRAYHDGYRKQVKSWPMNPLDVIIDSIKKMPKTHIIADFGCGEARLSTSVVQKVHSFDLVAANDTVVACDMSKVPLENNSIDVAIFCLSLMGTNLKDYLFEANRVLKIGGILKIAEVESRFQNAEDFIKGVQHFGFKNIWKDLSNNLFYFLDFKKERDVKNRKKLPTLSLLPCLYKKR